MGTNIDAAPPPAASAHHRTYRIQDPRMLFGFGVLLVNASLAFIIALGHVHQEASYGLEICLGSLSTLSGGFAQWAFSRRDDVPAGAPAAPAAPEKPS